LREMILSFVSSLSEFAPSLREKSFNRRDYESILLVSLKMSAFRGFAPKLKSKRKMSGLVSPGGL